MLLLIVHETWFSGVLRYVHMYTSWDIQLVLSIPMYAYCSADTKPCLVIVHETWFSGVLMHTCITAGIQSVLSIPMYVCCYAHKTLFRGVPMYVQHCTCAFVHQPVRSSHVHSKADEISVPEDKQTNIYIYKLKLRTQNKHKSNKSALCQACGLGQIIHIFLHSSG